MLSIGVGPLPDQKGLICSRLVIIIFFLEQDLQTRMKSSLSNLITYAYVIMEPSSQVFFQPG